MNNFFNRLNELPQQRRNLLIAVTTITAAIFANAIILLRLGQQTGVWQLNTAAAVFSVAVVASIISLVLAHRDRILPAVIIVFVSVSSILLIRTALLAGLGLMSSVIIFSVLLILVGQTLSFSAATRAMLIAAALSLLNMLLDQYSTWERPSIPELIRTTPMIAGLVVLILGVLTLRQFRDFSLRTKFILAFSFTGISVAVAVTYIFYSNLTQQSLHAFQGRAITAASIAVLQQNGDEFAKISSAEDPLYEKFRVQNLKIRKSDPLFIYVFTASKDENGFYFVVDAGEPGEEGIAAFGERYDDPSPTLADNYDTMTGTVVDPGIYTDQYGSFLTAYAPIFNSNGERVGVIGVDINADTIVQEQAELVNQALLVVFLTGLASVFFGYVIGNLLATSIAVLAGDTAKFAKGDFTARTNIQTNDEVGDLSRSFNYMADQIQILVSGLEEKVADRTKALSTSIEVSRRLSNILDQEHLITQVVEQVKNAFDYYHAHIYLFDERKQELVMAGGTGEAGKALLARGHRIPKNRGLVGRAFESKQAVLVPDTSAEPDWLPNPLLPDTRSEIAVPLLIGDEVLGVLDVQQNTVNGLTESDAELLQSLAFQAAIALKNAQSYSESRKQAEREALIGEISRKIQNTVTVEHALQVAVQELGTALGAKDSRVLLNLPDIVKQEN